MSLLTYEMLIIWSIIALLVTVVAVIPGSSSNSVLLDSANSVLLDASSNRIVHDQSHDKVKGQSVKVHNLVLNPAQHSWCELKHIRQIVTHAHCDSQEMENYVCVGTCFSYTVPQTIPETPGDDLLDYCDSCSAADHYWTTVSLDCENDGVEYEVTKNIQMITSCSCSGCKASSRSRPRDNDVTSYSQHRISEIIHKMIPDSHKKFNNKENNFEGQGGGGEPGQGQVVHTEIVHQLLPDQQTTNNNNNNNVDSTGAHVDLTDTAGLKIDLTDSLRYTQVSLGDLKKHFNLNDNQEKLLIGKVLIKDEASFTDTENDENGGRGYISY